MAPIHSQSFILDRVWSPKLKGRAKLLSFFFCEDKLLKGTRGMTLFCLTNQNQKMFDIVKTCSQHLNYTYTHLFCIKVMQTTTIVTY